MPSLVPREIEDNTYLKVEGVREGTGGGGVGGVGGEQIRCIVQCTTDEFLCTVSIEDYYLACITSIAVV